MSNFKDFLNEQLQDPKFKAEYDALNNQDLNDICENGYTIKSVEVSENNIVNSL